MHIPCEQVFAGRLCWKKETAGSGPITFARSGTMGVHPPAVTFDGVLSMEVVGVPLSHPLT